jgi:RHS repeat-associated protein
MEDLDGTHSYEYDPLYRLTQVTYPDQQVDTYTYDAVGNRLTKDTDDYTYNAADQLTDLEGTSFDYDDNGNQTDRGDDTFEYDHENRLTESVIDSVTSTSVYNGDGLRMSHTVGQTTTSYVWDVAAGLPVVLQDGTNTYVYGLDLISATDDQGAQTYFTYDGLGSTADLTDDEGDEIDDYTYDVFGAIRSQGGSSDNFWLFTGEQQDSDSSFYFLRARYYDPAAGRFLGRDPLGVGHRYAYTRNNPVRYADPYGLDIFDKASGVVKGGFDCATHPIDCAISELIPAGQIPLIPFTVSLQEGAACVWYPEECAIVFAAGLNADREMKRIYGDDVVEGTLKNRSPGDAFQHCFWSGSITLVLGADKAEKWTNRHEAIANNPVSQREYDQQNNARGRSIGESLRPNFGAWGRAPNPFALAKVRNLCQDVGGKE